MEIVWENIERTQNINACSIIGVRDHETSIGIIDGKKKFIRFRIYEAQYSTYLKGIHGVVLSETILPYSE